jgi:hypothetical protein
MLSKTVWHRVARLLLLLRLKPLPLLSQQGPGQYPGQPGSPADPSDFHTLKASRRM